MTLDRTQAPKFHIPEEVHFPKPIKRTLPNGVPLYFIPTPEIDAVRLEINTDSQKTQGAESKRLLAYFALHLLLDGTKTKSSEELDDFFDTYASEVEFSSTFEHYGISLLTTKKHFKTVFPVFRELLTESIFPEKELAKRKSQKALSISIQRKQNAARASQLFRQELFGPDHPYGEITDENDVAEINQEDLIQFYSNRLWFNPEIFVTGNLTEEELDYIITKMADLPAVVAENESPVFENNDKKRITEGRESSVQCSIRLGCHLVSKSHSDYFGIMVFNVFLGGYFGSRLIKNIREDKGHTYSIYSSVGSLKPADYWVVMADVIKEHKEEVITEIYKEIKKLQEEPLLEDEMETVRNYLAGNLLSTFSSSFDLIGRFKGIHQAGLDFSFYEKQLAFIRTFKAEDVQAIGKKYFNPDSMIEVIVG